MTRQKQRDVRGKAEPRGLPGTAERPLHRKQIFAAALKRVNRELGRVHALAARTAHVEAARRALALRRAAKFEPHPPAGDTAHEGMRALPSRRRRITISPDKIGRASQATKRAQAARELADLIEAGMLAIPITALSVLAIVLVAVAPPAAGDKRNF